MHADNVVIWERNEFGERVVKQEQAPFYFYYDDDEGKYTTIFDTKVSKSEFKSSRKMNAAKKEMKAAGVRLWESDIPPVLRHLSNKYYGKPAPKLNVTLLDIEVDYDPELGVTVMDMVSINPYAPINSVALIHLWKKEIVVLTVPPEPGWDEERLRKAVEEAAPDAPVSTELQIRYIVCDTESELLINLLLEIEDSDVLGGWNSDFFDMPYIAQRVVKVLDQEDITLETIETTNERSGRPDVMYTANPNTEIAVSYKFKWLKKLDFPVHGMPKFRAVASPISGKLMGNTIDLVGRVAVDYMNLVKKYEPGEKPSYALAAISAEVLVHKDTGEQLLPKLEYEGSLANLYRDNYPFFTRYNIRDTEILYGFEQKLGYIEVANQNVHLSTGLFSHVLGTLKLAELALVNYCHHEIKRVVNNSVPPPIDRSIDGALVLFPQTGLHELFGSIDINSLYPSAIRSGNMSPETLMGQFVETTSAADAIWQNDPSILITLVLEGTNEEITKPASVWREKLLEMKWSVSGYGTVFTQEKQGFIPALLAQWYEMRQHYQKLKKEAGEVAARTKGNESMQLEYDQAMQDAGYYDRLQYVFKIKLNSLYGALTNLHFRFFDLRLGESTTATGRAILRHQCRKVAEILEGNYNVDFPLYYSPQTAMKAGYTETEANEISLTGPKFNGEFQSDSVLYGDSVAGNTIIETESGPRTIESLFGDVNMRRGDKEYSNCNLTALTFDKSTGSTRYGRVKYVMRHKTSKQMYRVCVPSGEYVDVTEDHSIIAFRMGKDATDPFIEIKADDLIASGAHLIYQPARPGTQQMVANRVNSTVNADFELVDVARVEKLPIEEQYVYDIEVDDTHVFFANNILVHNTDSTYFHTYADNAKDAIMIADAIADKVNESFPEFMRDAFLCTTGYDRIIKAGREIVSDKGIFVEKKRYILHLIDLDGKPVNKMKVMGLDTKKSTLPVHVAKSVNKFMERFLTGETWESVSVSVVEYKDQLIQSPNLLDLGLPKGVNKIEQYTNSFNMDYKARLPGHVAAAIHYNQALKEYGDNISLPITSGMKIKVFYLKRPVGRFTSIALPTDIERIPDWFTENYHVNRKTHINKLVDSPLSNITKAIGKVSPTHQTLFEDDLFVY